MRPSRRNRPLQIVFATCCLFFTALSAAADVTFTLTEHFGVAHPDQILAFDLAQPLEPGKAVATMAIGSAAAAEVPCQVLADGKQIAVRSALAANETRTFVVKAGPRFELVGTNPLGEPISASAAAAGGRLYIRGEKHLFAITAPAGS